MKPEEYSERTLEVEGWQVRLTSYKLGQTYYCAADNISPGANIAKAAGGSRDEAEQKVLEKARERLGNTKRHAV